MKLPTKRVLVFDIETDSVDVDEARLRYFGAYSYLTNKRYYLKGEENIEFIKEMFDNHDVIVGFNQRRFDCPILEKYGIDCKYKIHVDLWEALSEPRLDPKTRIRSGGKGRGEYMGLKLSSWSLANIIKALDLGDLKKDFDYDLLKKDPSEWTSEEEKLILEYLAQDITITKKLFEYTNNFFYGFTEHLSERNISRFTYITASIASLAYKIVCFEADLEETYGDTEKDWEYPGGYVRYPTTEAFVGKGLCLDFRSLYPSLDRAFNLFSPADILDDVFTGNDFFKIKGAYRKDKQGPIEEAVAKLYALRKEYKKQNDRREYLIKIIINSLYGISAKPIFTQVYNRYGAEDCTAIGRQMIKHTADVFNDSGFNVLYGDTDSIFIALNNKSKEEALNLAKTLNEFFKSKMPFPHEDFGLGLDAEIKAMFFFPNDDKTYKKKNYIYITKDNKITIKGLPIIKRNASKIATTILNKYLKEQIIEKKSVKFPKDYLKQLIFYELENNLNLATQTYKVRSLDTYASKSSLYAQIAEKFDRGTHDLISNTRWGLGKGKKYCTVEEFKQHKLTVNDIDLSVTLSNLSPFIKSEQSTLDKYNKDEEVIIDV